MDIANQLLLFFFLTNCMAINITRLEVPALVPVHADHITLNCDYSLRQTAETKGFVVKWFFNERNLVYQWIPPYKPQAIGLLKGKIDIDFRISNESMNFHRAIKVTKLTTDMSGNYTCSVSTFLEEDRKTSAMLVYSPATVFRFVQEKKYVFLVKLICVAEYLYPKPQMDISSQGVSIKQAVVEYNMNSWGLYSVSSTAVVHDDDVTAPSQEFVCTLRIPQANYEINRTTVYYSGLMPTTGVNTIARVLEKAQERLSNDCQPSIFGEFKVIRIALCINLIATFI